MTTPIHQRWVLRVLLGLFCTGFGLTRVEAGCGDHLDFRQSIHRDADRPLDRLPGGARCQGPQCSKPVPLHPVQVPFTEFQSAGGKGLLVGLLDAENDGSSVFLSWFDAKPFLPSGHPLGLIKPPRA